MLLLFDIDGTLVDTGGAGVRALARALGEHFGADDGLEGVPLAGRTDWAILADALARVAPQHRPDRRWIQAFSDRYVMLLEEELRRGAARARVLPGVMDTLDAAARTDGVHVALLTGNFARGAEAKLRHFGLWDRFAFGAFGDDALDRNDLLPVALARARAAGVPMAGAGDVVVIGDTPHDVACARSGGAMAVAVATGPYRRDALAAAGADLVLDTLCGFWDALDQAVPGGGWRKRLGVEPSPPENSGSNRF